MKITYSLSLGSRSLKSKICMQFTDKFVNELLPMIQLNSLILWDMGKPPCRWAIYIIIISQLNFPLEDNIIKCI